MSNSPEQTKATQAERSQFTATHWSVVLAAGEPGSSECRAALDTLCRTYWHPLYAYIRRRGHQPHDTQDLTQAFFARLLEKDYLRSVDRSKGKFRSFLLAAVEHFLANEWRRANAQKRGGNFTFSSLDDTSAEQQWAMALLQKALGGLQQEFAASGKGALFEEIKMFLTGEKHGTSYAQLAAKLGMSEGALKMATSRMRQRYGELLRAEIVNTVASPDEVDGELRALFGALSP